jgi:prolyl-tRNA synthetase
VTREDGRLYAERILHEVYEGFMRDVLALPVVVGRKTPKERFAGAVNTMTCEAMMGDGKALQMGTSHELGQNFAKAFDIQYLDAEGTQQLAWTTSWGVSTRMVGGLIMGHGDDAGLRVPPVLAPVQVVVIAVRDDDAVIERCRALAEELTAAGVRVELDVRVETSMGRRATDWELKGVPLRLELGPRDLADDVVTLVRRITGSKGAVALGAVVGEVEAALAQGQADLLAEATERRDSRTADVATVAEAAEAATIGWARISWSALRTDGEVELAKESVTVRCLVMPDGSLPTSDDADGAIAIVARSY